MEALLDILQYKREALTQLLVVASIFGGFAVGGVMTFLGTTDRGRLRSALFATLAIAALAFITATVLDALMLPGMFRGTYRDTAALRGLLGLGDVVVWAVLVGSVALVGAVAGSGFLFSRWVGRVVLAATLATVTTVAVTLVYLARYLG